MTERDLEGSSERVKCLENLFSSNPLIQYHLCLLHCLACNSGSREAYSPRCTHCFRAIADSLSQGVLC